MSRNQDQPRKPTARAEIVRVLSDRHGGRCQSCGTGDAPLELAHIVPAMKGGRHGLDNLALLCRNCHQLLRSFRPSGLEFERFLSDILAASPDYADVVPRSPLSTGPGTRQYADFAVTRVANARRERILIEAKAWSSSGRGHVQHAIEQIARYRAADSFDRAALVFPGRLGEEERTALEAAAIEVWDLDHVAAAFADEIASQPPSGYRLLYSLVARSGGRDKSEELVARLKACRPGTDWSAYQRLIAHVFEYLFAPPLMPPIWERSDAPRANRRDIILPNYAADGFWRYLRETYDAHYVVVDAKDYRSKITKPQALQIANYLKPHGTGMFGIIATRCGANAACIHTIREQWALHRKMIVLLSDEDVATMLRVAGSAGKPEDVIGQIIQDFRLSM